MIAFSRKGIESSLSAEARLNLEQHLCFLYGQKRKYIHILDFQCLVIVIF